MKVVEGKFGNDDKEATASDALNAFSEMAEEYEETSDDGGQVVIVYINAMGIMVGGNTATTAEAVLALQCGIHSVMESVLTGGDFDESVH